MTEPEVATAASELPWGSTEAVRPLPLSSTITRWLLWTMRRICVERGTAAS
jgi:hypothetical protein